MARCGCKSGYHKDLSLRTSNDSRILNHLSFIVNINFLGGVWDLCDHSKRKKNRFDFE